MLRFSLHCVCIYQSCFVYFIFHHGFLYFPLNGFTSIIISASPRLVSVCIFLSAFFLSGQKIKWWFVLFSEDYLFYLHNVS